MINYKNLKPVVGIDLTTPVAQSQHGMAAIIQNLFHGINQIEADLRFIAFCTNKNIHLYQEYNSNCVNIIINSPEKWVEDGNRLDIMHHPFNSISNQITGVINLVTVCDLIPFKHQELYPNSNNKAIIESYRNADHILTISESARMDIENCLGINASKISHCVISSEFPELPIYSGLTLPNDYLVFPAAFRPHKNHARLLRALAKSDSNIRLVFSTGESHDPVRNKSIFDLIEEYDLTARVQSLGCLERQQYYELIYRSKGIIYPSLAEGFGLPVLEGLIANKNIACSQISSLIEITNGEALYFNPYDENQIKNKIEALWEKRDEKNGLSNSKRVLEKYSISNQTSQYISLYKKLYEQNLAKYRPSIKSSGESIIESANALFHSSYFGEKSVDLYTFASDLYKDAAISEGISQPVSIKSSKTKVDLMPQTDVKTFVLLMDVTRLFTGNPYSGISKYVDNVLQQLLNVSNIVTIPFYDRKARGFRGDRNSEQNYLHKFLDGSLVSILEGDKAANIASHLDLPVIFFSSYHPLPKERNPIWKYCLTIFDVIHLTEVKYYPDGANSKKYITSDIINSIISSDMILPISRYSLNDTKRCLPFSIRASIVYLAPGIIKSTAIYNNRDIDILVPFQNDPRKGFQRMLTIIHDVLENTKQAKRLKICFFGRAELNSDKSFNDLVAKFPDSVSFAASPDELELVSLYKKAKCFLYLSEAEGFGMPPLEAMSCGSIPVVLNNTSLSEIFSGWSYLLENQASDSIIISNVLKIVFSDELAKLADAAIIFSSKYTWENTRNLHLAAFSKLLGG